eukprot:CAMPEP_0178906814 /NCGR_PEP_ID=MMETSP0786-20121207/7027_1 /TAXON_ID=186022 /ORGANISM="Thalassionema frauenfeldii, Strain CCMP 1798" /LENGTH=794 /DNA_ID=CAMNT_0020578549 /DNA_START=201 /DNA_END=2585 /DNA_ORIENTATION=+
MTMETEIREDDNLTVGSSNSISIPRRNLTEQFDDLYVDAATPETKDLKITDEESPVGVCEIFAKETDVSSSEPVYHDDQADIENDVVPPFRLHEDLARDLSPELVRRVSFYTVIHDINKEASNMASDDFAAFGNVKSVDEDDESNTPLVMAAKGQAIPKQPLSMSYAAVIDEERWLLRAIAARGDTRSNSATCPPTFLQAMGEREYENSLSSFDSSRTQLWKPSRSWWEAKSGKNPWIEPKSHNKRWRYLWPLIHYHKFLAKCIKKLKRNKVDVKISVTPVAVFLREEVCAVSDHLAAVSLFQSEQWMNCLASFNGWTDTSPEAESRLRSMIEKLALRPLEEPGDVDSPLLRSQIDEHFLRTMVASRESMKGTAAQSTKRAAHGSSPEGGKHDNSLRNADNARPGLPLHPHSRNGNNLSNRTRPSASGLSSKINQASKGDAFGESRPPYVYHNGQWWSNGWSPQFAYCDETNSVQSALSVDSYPLGYPVHYDPNFHGMYRPPPMQPFYPHQSPSAEETAKTDAAQYPPNTDAPFYPSFEQYPTSNPNWYGQIPIPTMLYAQSGGIAPPPGMEAAPEAAPEATNHTGFSPHGQSAEHTPHKDYAQSPMPISPFWSHLDYQMHTTLALAGAITPHKAPPRSPPCRKSGNGDSGQKQVDEKKEADNVGSKEEIDAKPLLITHASQYYPYGAAYGEQDGYVPPSPATQFMMSPQANPQAAAYYAYNYGANAYYHSPYRSESRKRNQIVETEEASMNQQKMATPPPAVHKAEGCCNSELNETDNGETTTELSPKDVNED